MAIIVFAWFCAAMLLVAVGSIFFFLIAKGGASIDLQMIFGTTPVMDALTLKRDVFQGLFPAIFGTILLVTVSVAIALPIGLAAGIYLAEYGKGVMANCFSFL